LVAGILRQNGGPDVNVTVTASWTCPGCGRDNTSPFCPSCGERPRNPRDLTLRGLLDHAFEAITNIDGRLLRTFRALVGAPGSLTTAFVNGRRKAFIGPVALFLVANVLFFAVESLTHGLVFTTPLWSHMNEQPWDVLARVLVPARLAAEHATIETYAPRFDGAIALHARSLILVMVVALAGIVALVFRRRDRPIATHVVFALHLYAYMLLLFSIAAAAPAAGMVIGRPRSTSQNLDTVLSLALLVGCGLYLYNAIGAVYGGTRRGRVGGAVGLTLAVALLVLAYRFALFLLTLYTT
jgi:hypothetical protein